MSDRRRVWITGIGLDHRDRHRASTRSGPGCGPARSPVKRIDRFDPSPFRIQVAAQVDDFDPLAWMPPKTARQLDRFSQFGLVAGRLALDDAGLRAGRGRRGGPGADRDLPRLGARRASPTPRSSTSGTSSAGIRPVAPNLALAVFGGAAPANLGHRARRPRPDPVDRQLVRVGGGRARRGARATCARAGSTRRSPAACEIPLSPLAFGAFDIIRALSAGHNDDAGDGRPAVRRGPRRVRHGRGRGAARARGGGRRRARAAPSRTPSCWATARPRTRTTWSSRGPTAREAARAATIALDDAGRRARRDRLRQRPRLVDADRRRRRGAGDRAGARRARGDRAGQRHEGAVRPPARRVGRDRGRDLRAGHPRRLGAGVGQPRRARSGRRGAAAGPAARRAATGPTAACCRPRSGSAGSTRRWCFGAVDG